MGRKLPKSVHTRAYREFLKLLREARIASNQSQADIAAKIGQTQSFYSKCERGERRIDIIELRAICRAIGITLTEFVANLKD